MKQRDEWKFLVVVVLFLVVIVNMAITNVSIVLNDISPVNNDHYIGEHYGDEQN